LHDPAHVSSARDMAMIARALLREFPDHADLFNIGALQLGNQYIPNHNGLLGRYPGADGMKTGFTCPAGFNVVASANHSGRRLIVVVLGAPTAKSRNQEAADLFDRGFAMGGGSGSLESLASSGSAAPQRSDACLHHSAAAIAAAEDEGVAEPIQAAAPAGRGIGFPPNPFAALLTPVAATHTQLSDEKIRFDPVPVFLGPAPGWKGPALGARPTGVATASDNPQGVADAPASPHGVSNKPKPKPIRHAAAETKAQKLMAAKNVKPKIDNSDNIKQGDLTQ
jgi:D-alanyl-D-alanine carboxypeptidase